MSAEPRTDVAGVAAGALAFSLWGLLPIYFKVADGVGSLEMLVHRIVWAVPVGLVIILARRQWPQVRQALRERRTALLLVASAAFIAVNWLGYIYAVQSGNIFQASLGYYINPLMLVLVGFAVLGERLTPLQTGAVVLAAAGVLVLTVQGGAFPWISLMLATSFTFYGLIRKQANVAAMPGLFVETLILFPPALVFLVLAIQAGTSPFGPANPAMSGILLLAGPFTVIPLLLFAIAARRLRLATIGFLQFIAPTGQFLVGLAYGEQLTTAHIICFSLIWGAVALFVFDAVRATARR
ncbi:MAG: EamA family transporter RarD [Pseudomonadota bacterium]